LIEFSTGSNKKITEYNFEGKKMSHISPTNRANSSGSKRSPNFDFDFEPDFKRRKIEDERVNHLVQEAWFSSWQDESDMDNLFEFGSPWQELPEAQKVRQSVGTRFNGSRESSKVANPQNPPQSTGSLDAQSSSNDKTKTTPPPNYKEQLSFGKDHYNKGNYEETIKVFENLLTAPNDFDKQTLNDIQHDLAHSYYQLGRFQEALDSFRKVSELDPGIATVHMWKGFCCAALGRKDSEAEHFQRALDIFMSNTKKTMDDPTARYQMGICNFSLNQTTLAKLYFDSITHTDPNYRGAQYYLGCIEYTARNYDKAMTHLLLYLKNAKTSSQKYSNAQFYVGSIYYFRKDYLNVIEYLEKLDPTSSHYEKSKPFLNDAYCELGKKALTEKNYQVAIDWFSKVSIPYRNYRDVEDGLGLAYENLGREHRKKGEFEEAIAVYRKIPERCSSFKSICVDLAGCYFKTKNYQDAIDLLMKPMPYLNPDKVNSMLGMCYFYLGKFDIAYDFLIKVDLSKLGNYCMFQFMFGVIFLYSKEYQKAIPHFENIGSDDKSYGRAQCMLGETYREWGHPLDALKHFDKALKCFKNDPEAQPLYDETQRRIYMVMNFELDEFDVWYLTT
jgi:tetratricopeptide (TPR) repeat protein